MLKSGHLHNLLPVHLLHIPFTIPLAFAATLLVPAIGRLVPVLPAKLAIPVQDAGAALLQYFVLHLCFSLTKNRNRHAGRLRRNAQCASKERALRVVTNSSQNLDCLYEVNYCTSP